MKKALPVILSVAVCLVVAIMLPRIGTSNLMVDDFGCLECHDADFPGGTLHSTHFNCADCHEGGAGMAGNVASANWLACHPEIDSETCDLVLFHEDSMDYDPSGASCLACHPDCEVEPTTTTTTDVSTTTTTADVTTTTTTAVVTTTTTTISDLSIKVSPDPMLRSRWVFLPVIISIQGDGTSFAMFTSMPNYSPSNALFALPALVLGPELIFQAAFVNPSWLAGTPGDSQTVTATVDGLSDDFTINLLPFFLDVDKHLK